MPTRVGRILATVTASVVPLSNAGCSTGRAPRPDMPPVSEQPVAVGDRITHVNGEPVKDFIDLQLKTATAEGDMTFTVERKDGRIERVVRRRR